MITNTPLTTLRACIDRLGVLSTRYAPTSEAHEATARRLCTILRDLDCGRYVRVTEGLVALKADVSSFVSFGGPIACAIQEARGLLFAAIGFVEDIESAMQVVVPMRRVGLGVGR